MGGTARRPLTVGVVTMRFLLFIVVCSALFVGCGQKPSANSQDRVSKQQQKVAQTKDRLLHRTDPQALLAAFREVMRTRKSFPRDPRWKGPGGDVAAASASVSFIKPDDAKLPPVIRDLHAGGISCFDDHLNIVFRGQKGPVGFVAGAEGFTNITDAVPNAKFENVIDGLWFYGVGN
jgi:hypothetical protein